MSVWIPYIFRKTGKEKLKQLIISCTTLNVEFCLVWNTVFGNNPAKEDSILKSLKNRVNPWTPFDENMHQTTSTLNLP